MSLFDRLIVWSLPWVPKALVRRFASRYVAGESLDEALTLVRRFNRDGYLCTLDVLGEFVNTPEEVQQAAAQYKEILAVLAQEGLAANISVKPSQMGLLLDRRLCYETLRDLVATARQFGNFVRVEMEDTQCTSDTIDIYLALRQEFDNVGIVLQAYLRRTLADAKRIMAAGGGHFRLCKGIYIEPRELAFKDKALINKNYTRVLEEMLAGGAYVGIATHDEALYWEAARLVEQYQLPPEAYEFQMLLGVDPQLRQIIRDDGHRLRVYVPFGKHWYAYCIRRLRENPTLARYTLQNLWRQITGAEGKPHAKPASPSPQPTRPHTVAPAQ
jgi:proline dehydrogenase